MEVELFRRLVEKSPDGMVVIDDKRKIMFVNDAACKIIKYKKEEIIGRDALNFVPKDLKEKIGEIYEKRLRGEKVPSRYETKLLTKYGKEVFVELNDSVIKYKNRIYDILTIRDITEKKEIEKEIKRSEEKFRKLFELAADPIIILDKTGKFVEVNNKFTEILGYSKEEVVGKKITQVKFLTRKSKLIAMKNFLKRMAGMEIKPYELEIVAKNGEKLVTEINASPLKENGKLTGDIVIARNITERKKIEEELLKRNEELERMKELFIGRELRIKELKEKMKKLEEEIKLLKER